MYGERGELRDSFRVLLSRDFLRLPQIKSLLTGYNLGQNKWKTQTPPPPQIKYGKMARFCPSRGFILDLGGGWGFAVPFYFVQDCSSNRSAISGYVWPPNPPIHAPSHDWCPFPYAIASSCSHHKTLQTFVKFCDFVEQYLRYLFTYYL